MTRRGAVSAKAEQIVVAAPDLFMHEGYAATSMDAIALWSGVSKPTLYSHFQSKEGLFSQVMARMCKKAGQDECLEFANEGSPHEVLKAAALHMCERVVKSEQGRDLLRTIICESPAFPELGQIAWETGPGTGCAMLAEYLAGLDGQGEVNVTDPVLMAGAFFGMVTGPFLVPTLLGAEQPPNESELNEKLDELVSVFLKGISV